MAPTLDESTGKLNFYKFNANYFGKKNGDCVIRALCVATGYGYKKICEMLDVPFIMGVGFGWNENQGITKKQMDDFANKYGIIEEVYCDDIFLDWIHGDLEDDMMDPADGFSLEDMVLNKFIPDKRGYRRLLFGTRSNKVKQKDGDFKMHCVAVDNHTNTYYDVDTNETAKYSLVMDIFRVIPEKICKPDSPDYYNNERKRILEEYRELRSSLGKKKS